ncbi:H-NS histone family protein [Salinimonas chungwhensis]|uniref:H-NS histone family protein n=1 Tax=Salinimonas chungwhensis TaxID=265425 RepID=UPI00037AD85E|nr:H-NS family nucleoid-associated regulatory protein [Salinimonas chungwhensis]
MTDFTDTLTHQRKLQAATNELTVEQLEDIRTKLENIIEKRREKAAAQEAEKAEKNNKIESVLALLQEEGLSLDDLTDSNKPSKNTGKKRPIKYRLVDEQGKEHLWTGIGRMPKVYKQALDNGNQLEEYEIK